MQSPAWEELRKAAQVQIDTRRNKYYRSPLKEGQTIFEQQFELGEATGIELFLKLPEIVLAAATAVIEEARQNEPTPENGAIRT